MPGRPELKQFHDLTAADFQRHPIWVSVHVLDYGEPWHDDTDEETFRPWLDERPVFPGEAIFLIQATMTLHDGRQLHGFFTPCDDVNPSDPGRSQPRLFLPSGTAVAFWLGRDNISKAKRAALYDELGHNPHAIFPIRYEADDSLSYGQISGIIPGFEYLKDGETEITF